MSCSSPLTETMQDAGQPRLKYPGSVDSDEVRHPAQGGAMYMASPHHSHIARDMPIVCRGRLLPFQPQEERDAPQPGSCMFQICVTLLFMQDACFDPTSCVADIETMPLHELSYQAGLAVAA